MHVAKRLLPIDFRPVWKGEFDSYRASAGCHAARQSANLRDGPERPIFAFGPGVRFNVLSDGKVYHVRVLLMFTFSETVLCAV